MGIDDTLRSLRDVQGVFGSFVITRDGAVAARDLPEVFSDELFARVGPRLVRLSETLSSDHAELDDCVVRYSEHKLHLRRIGWGLVGVISAHEVNASALRMVTNLVVRRIDPELPASFRPPPVSVPIPHPPVPARVAAPAPAAAPVPQTPPRVNVVPQDGRGSGALAPSSERRARMYRGRFVDEE